MTDFTDMADDAGMDGEVESGEPFAYEDLVFATTHLCDLLEVETDAILRHDIETVRELADNKIALTRLYRQSAATLAEDPSRIDQLPGEQRDELRELCARLEELVDVNARTLRAELDAVQRVMSIVVDSVKRNAESSISYGAGGVFGSKGPSANSLAFNKTL